jgi:hypothetical protein
MLVKIEENRVSVIKIGSAYFLRIVPPTEITEVETE